MTDYHLRCLGTGDLLDDTNLPLQSEGQCEPAFLRTEYGKKQIDVGPESDGIYRYADWLPVRRALQGSSAPVTYRSEGLARELGMNNLAIVFSGYWPERGAYMRSGTFKECEAYSVCARMPENYGKTLVVASAGNTARAFARVCSANGIDLVIVVPEMNQSALWFDGERSSCVKLVCAGGDSDYFDAIQLSQMICDVDGFMPEGGAKNVARRDGMGTTVLSAATTLGYIPDSYYQAVGSGTGAIAAWEANMRLIGDGRFGENLMRLIVSQNDPFLLLHDSWKAGSRELTELSPEDARSQSAAIYAKVLSNRKPPYGITGGLFDALKATNGDVVSVSNDEAKAAGRIFRDTEGIDPAPAASVAIASLISAVKRGKVGADERVLLNVTGGGIERVRSDIEMSLIEPAVVVPREKIEPGYVKEVAKSLLSNK